MNAIRENVSSVSDGTELKTEFGIAFNLSETAEDVLRFSDEEEKQMRSSLRTRDGATQFRDLFFGKNASDLGMAERLLKITESAQRDITRELGSTGVYFDLYA